MTDKDIQQLIDRYLDGTTSAEEEKHLARELLRDDIPADWQAVRLMMGELAMGEAEYDDIMERRANRPSAILAAIRVITSVAAVFLVGLFFYLQAETPTETVATHYTPKEQKLPSPQPAYCTEGTPREILMCYLERKRDQPNTYHLIKQKIYESQH